MKGTKFSIKFLIVFVLLFCFSQPNTLAVSYSVNFTKEDLSFGQENEFQIVLLKGCYPMGEIGKPQLPVRHIQLLIPQDMDVDSIIITNQTSFQVQGNYYILPAQHSVPYDYPPVTYPFVEPDSIIYNSNKSFPGKLAELVRHDVFDGCNRIATIAVYPLQYQPAESTLTLYTELSFELSLKASKAKATQPKFRSTHLQKGYNQLLRSMINNPEDVPEYGGGAQTLGSGGGVPFPPLSSAKYYEYVIITDDSLRSYFDGYIHWMNEKGLRCSTVAVTDVRNWFSSGDSISSINDVAGSIRQYLYKGWKDYGTVYALLAGVAKGPFPSPAIEIVPVRVGAAVNNPDSFDVDDTLSWWQWIPTDLYYSDFDGNWNVDGNEPYGYPAYGEPFDDSVDYAPEIFVGRLPCVNGKDILNWTEKVLKYEITPGEGDFTYLKRHLCGEADFAQEHHECENAVQPRFTAQGWSTSLLKEYATSPSGSQYVDSMNSGYGFVDWHHHGKPTAAFVRTSPEPQAMVTTYDAYPDTFTETGNGVDNLANENKYSIMYAVNCDLAAYDIAHYQEQLSIGEGFTVMEKKGGPCFLGNTRYGWGLQSIEAEKIFLDTLFANELSLSEAEAYSKWKYSPNARGHEIALSHSVIGDPQLHAWCTPCPDGIQEFVVTYLYQSDEVMVQDTSGNNLDGVLVGISNEQNGYRFSDTTINGIVESAPEDSTYDLDTNDIIVVTEPNYLPSIRRMGHINGSVTWKGLVIVSGDIIVNQDRILTIEPGTEIVFEQEDDMSTGEDAGKCEIRVLGKLVAKGTEDDSIFFGRPRWTTNPIPNWYGIVADSGGVVNIEYAEVKNAYAGFDLKAGSKDTILFSTIYNNYFAGIINSSNDAVIANNLIDRDPNLCMDAKYGIYLENVNTGAAFSLLSNLIKNYEIGIRVKECSTMFINNAIVSGVNSTNGIYVSNQSEVSIKENEIYGPFDSSYIHCISSCINLLRCKMWGNGDTPKAVHYLYPNGGVARENEIKDYIVGIWSSSGLPPDWGRDTADYPGDSIGNNCFELSGTYIQNLNTQDTLYAQLNWWGTASPNPNNFTGRVKYWPWLLEDPGWIPQKVVSKEVIASFRLLQNYPNPFNPITDIQYTLPTDCKVKLVIYNVLGQKVRTLVNEHQTAGFKIIRWDGKTDRGSEVSTGIYLYKLQAGDFIETKKMLLLK